MNFFHPCAALIAKTLPILIADSLLHAKWLNTLSYLENCGARKIAACEHPTIVKEEMLKHAAEEFRHAHYLKTQIERVSALSLEDYGPDAILGGKASLNYLQGLDLQASRYLSKTIGLQGASFKHAAYLLVTFAIELRAAELYPLYDFLLKKNRSKVTIKSILLEEEEHLKEMRQELEKLPRGMHYAAHICTLEAQLCRSWLTAIYSTSSREQEERVL